VGLGEGSTVGEGLGAGAGAGVGGPPVYPCVEGWRKSSTGLPASACVMKSCQMSAGIVPPNTAE
jgi:hypothetical protein